MGHPDDYRDEMERLSSGEADEVLSGRAPERGAAAFAASAVERLRRELLTPPAADVAERHVAAMRAGIEGGRRMRRTKKQVATLGLAATLVLGAGLAGALTLPEQAADEAKERTAGVELPVPGPTGSPADGGEGPNEAAASHGKLVSEAARDDSTEGCEKGRAVSGIASSKADEHRNDDVERPDPCSAGDGATDEGAGNGSGGGGSAQGSGGGSGGPGGGGGGGGSTHGSGGGSGGSGGGGGGGGSTQGSGGGSGGSGGGSGSGGPSGVPAAPPEDLPTPGE